MGELRILPVDGIGEIRPGDDLATVVVAAAPWLAEGDIVVLTSKIVSKAEGCLVRLPSAEPARQAAWDATLAAQTARPVASRGRTRIVRTHGGLVLASAGIDASNVDASTLLVLPVDPDASARSIRAAIRKRAGIDVAVIISDTMGRPWRLGLVDVAIGVAGLRPLVDYRGQRDPYGNELAVTVTAVADELAAATDLVQGKLSRIPVAVVRGLVPD
ncbi:MAG: coenzyme F420-0:L-glutamate ligase, partial [Dactylosporangium sp.]|nr:coenzyme F420-0:L-glutamate ligase [Dactylosporangium sp.]NNJ60151.1 coenzyme F420-0:L-glutamate ligase [Dactylosporangium sp.]